MKAPARPVDGLMVWPSARAAGAWIATQPVDSRRRMHPQFVGAYDGWIVEWLRSDGRLVMKAAGEGWA